MNEISTDQHPAINGPATVLRVLHLALCVGGMVLAGVSFALANVLNFNLPAVLGYVMCAAAVAHWVLASTFSNTMLRTALSAIANDERPTREGQQRLMQAKFSATIILLAIHLDAVVISSLAYLFTGMDMALGFAAVSWVMLALQHPSTASIDAWIKDQQRWSDG